MNISTRSPFHTLCFRLLLPLLFVTWCSSSPGQSGLIAAWGNNSDNQIRVPADVGPVRAIAAGAWHSLAIKADGTVAGWGANFDNQISIPPGLSNVIALSAGQAHSLALKADGTVAAWGYNLYGNQYGLTNVPTGLSNVTAIAAGYDHNVALKGDGTVIAWGYNSNGQTNVPPGLSNVVAIAAGIGHSLALKADGTVVAWGYNSDPQSIVPPGLNGVKAVAAGANYSLALKANGTVVAWGQNDYGQTDVPPNLSNVRAIAAGNVFAMALKVDGTIVTWGSPVNIPPGLAGATAIAAGHSHGLALVSSGPVVIAQGPDSLAVPLGSNATFSVTASGQPPLSYQWFRNGVALTESGHVSGTLTATLSISNAALSDAGIFQVVISNPFGSVISTGATFVVISPPFFTQVSQNRTVGAGADVTFVAAANGTPPLRYQWFFNNTPLAGRTNSALTLTNVQPGDAGIYSMFVTNQYGEAQTNITLNVTNTPPTILRQPNQLPNQEAFNPKVQQGGSVTLSVVARGSLPLSYQWRFNGADIPDATNATVTLTNMRYDQTGYYNVVVSNPFGEVISAKVFVFVAQIFVWPSTGTGIPTNIPPGLTNLVSIAAGDYHVLGLKTDGRVVTWINFNYTPAVMSLLTNVPANVTNVIAIAAGGTDSMALRSDGRVIVWGSNDYGQTNVPVSATNVMGIAIGSIHCLAVRSNGTVVAWGNNYIGQSTPPPGLSNVVAVAAGSLHSLALKSDGTVVGWGSSNFGETNVPAGLTNVIAIEASANLSLALKTDGTVVAWGSKPALFATGPNGSNVVAMASGLNDILVLRANGTPVSLLSSIIGGFPTPPPVPAIFNAISIAAGKRMSADLAVVGNGSPAFTIQPFPAIAERGRTVQFHARAAGVQPISYQWQLNGQNIPGATNADLALLNVQGANTGGYRVVVSNTLGSATSRVAQLTIPFTGTLAFALNATNLTWNSSSSTSDEVGIWFAQIRETHDGVAAAQSGAISNGQQSILQTVISQPGTLSFWWKVSSEEGYDFLSFYIDSTTVPRERISGETGWVQYSMAITAGLHTLRWVYAKDSSVSAGQDAGWVDEVVFTPSPPVINRQPTGQVAWMGSLVSLQAICGGASPLTYQWLKNGTNVPGANSTTLTLTNVTRRDSADYTLRISNGGGTVTSSNATVLVRVPQRLNPPAVQPDGTVVLKSSDADGGQLGPSDLAGFEGQASTNLVNWVTLPGALSLANGSILLHDVDSARYPVRFYRVVEH